MYAVWFLFEDYDQNYLSEIISSLSEKFTAPKFTPHITAYGLFENSLELVDKIILESIKNMETFNVNTSQISYSNNFWKTVFIEFENNYSLNNINQILEHNLKKNYDFFPHCSLIYKEMKLSEKMQLTQSLKIKESLTINRVGVLKFSKNIADWVITKQYFLDQA